jgi:hypothetical protein
VSLLDLPSSPTPLPQSAYGLTKALASCFFFLLSLHPRRTSALEVVYYIHSCVPLPLPHLSHTHTHTTT